MKELLIIAVGAAIVNNVVLSQFLGICGPIRMPDGTTLIPDKGTPQGGIISPLLANIVLNEDVYKRQVAREYAGEKNKMRANLKKYEEVE